jgi:hypothetical protein
MRKALCPARERAQHVNIEYSTERSPNIPYRVMPPEHVVISLEKIAVTLSTNHFLAGYSSWVGQQHPM